MMTTQTPFTLDPQKILETQRRAALAALDGAIALQDELKKAFDKGLEKARKEAESFASQGTAFASDATHGALDLSRRALTTARDELARFGKAPADPA
jgi:hypothetical protein